MSGPMQSASGMAVVARHTLRRQTHRLQRGVTTLVTLLLLVVMLLGGVALARFGEVGSLASGNAAFREAALQASEVGINTAYVAVQGLVDEESNSGNWYWAKSQALDTSGMPSTVSWSSAPEVVVGNYKVRYVVERLCTGAGAITDPVRQCVNKIKKPIESHTRRDQLDPPTAKLYRVTVRVTGPRDTQSFVQSLLTRG